MAGKSVNMEDQIGGFEWDFWWVPRHWRLVCEVLRKCWSQISARHSESCEDPKTKISYRNDGKLFRSMQVL